MKGKRTPGPSERSEWRRVGDSRVTRVVSCLVHHLSAEWESRIANCARVSAAWISSASTSRSKRWQEEDELEDEEEKEMVEAERFSDSASIMETLFMALQQRKRENISVVGVVIRVTVERAKNRTEQRERGRGYHITQWWAGERHR